MSTFFGGQFLVSSVFLFVLLNYGLSANNNNNYGYLYFGKKVISITLVNYSTKPLFDLKKLSFLNVVLIFKINPMHIEGIAAVNIDHSTST